MKTSHLLNNSDVLNYHTLVQSIPKPWKANIKNNNILINTTDNNLLKKISKSTSPNKYLYNIQLNKIASNLIIKPHNKWDQEINKKGLLITTFFKIISEYFTKKMKIDSLQK
jgi:hypothetical protein